MYINQLPRKLKKKSRCKAIPLGNFLTQKANHDM